MFFVQEHLRKLLSGKSVSYQPILSQNNKSRLLKTGKMMDLRREMPTQLHSNLDLLIQSSIHLGNRFTTRSPMYNNRLQMLITHSWVSQCFAFSNRRRRHQFFQISCKNTTVFTPRSYRDITWPLVWKHSIKFHRWLHQTRKKLFFRKEGSHILFFAE